MRIAPKWKTLPGKSNSATFWKTLPNHINSLKNADGTEHGYVGDLKFNRKLTFKEVEQQAVGFAQTIPPTDRKSVTVDGIKQCI